jgi:phospholipid transport system substrate-binding protein
MNASNYIFRKDVFCHRWGTDEHRLKKHFIGEIGAPSVANFLIPFVVVCALSLAQPAFAQTPTSAPTTAQTPRGVIDAVVHDVIAILRDQNLTKEDKLTKIRAIADEQTDFETLARLAMGRNWRDLTDAQRPEFVKEFEEYVSQTHGKVFDQYVDEDVVINGEHAEQRGDYTVQTTIVANRFDAGRRKDVANVDYRLRQKDNRWKIIDVTIDGVSMAANFRAQFQEIIANGGVDRLMKLLREKNLPTKK